MFDFFKKKEKDPAYDVTNLSIRNLDMGFVFDYNMKSWVVKEMWEYDWGDNNFTMEFKVDSGDEVGFLGIEDEGELWITLSKAIRIHKIEEDVVEEIEKKQKPPRKLHYEGDVYFLEDDSAGYCRDASKETENWEEFINWDYYTDDESKVLSITQWDEHNIEAHAGHVLKEHEFSNFLPGQNEN